MKYLVMALLILSLLIAGYFYQQPSLVGGSSSSKPSGSSLHDHAGSLGHDGHHHDSAHPPASDAQGEIPEGKTGNPHFDQLSPEMQQAVKDSLLLEGPMKTNQRPDGAIELPANGRFTQMPVAVEMPDGSIQIREYTVTPKAKTKTEP